MDSDQLLRLSQVRQLVRTGVARSVRLGAALSLSDVATHLGVSKSTVHRWEAGQRLPHGDAGLRYGELLDKLARGATARRQA